MGPMGGPMDFGKNKSKFQEVPETGITFDDVAVGALACSRCTYPAKHLPHACILVCPRSGAASQTLGFCGVACITTDLRGVSRPNIEAKLSCWPF